MLAPALHPIHMDGCLRTACVAQANNLLQGLYGAGFVIHLHAADHAYAFIQVRRKPVQVRSALPRNRNFLHPMSQAADLLFAGQYRGMLHGRVA